MRAMGQLAKAVALAPKSKVKEDNMQPFVEKLSFRLQ